MAVSVYTLFSSSKGNSSYVTDGKTSFLIDAGASAKKVTDALSSIGRRVDSICAIYVTHEHTDHISGISCLCKKYNFPVHAISPTAEKIEADNVIPHDMCYTETAGDFAITSFPTSHDSKSSCGYVIEHKSGMKIGSMTDTGYVTEDMIKALCGCYAVILESNYDERMLISGAYPMDLKYRISSDRGHLSNSQSAEILPVLYKNGTRRVLLAHLSPENNTPELALKSALSAKEKYGLHELDIACADRYAITRLI